MLRKFEKLASGTLAPTALLCLLTCTTSLRADASFEGVLDSLAQSEYRFTPDVRSTFLAHRKAQALKTLAERGIELPKPVLAWVDLTPEAASTIYGIRHGTPAQALVLLTSLAWDLGASDLKDFRPLALAVVALYAPDVDLSDPEALPYVSLKPRKPVLSTIPETTLAKVDTHPKDRPLDINDHIINFMEEEEVLRNGKVVAVEAREKHIRACDIVASKALQTEFNTYMQRKVKDFKPLACGESLHWKYGGVSWRLPERKELGRAYDLFLEAYTAKGRLPKKRDPMPTPVEWAIYHIGNAKSEERKATLPDVWPYAMYLIMRPQPLREAEFAWDEKARGLRPRRYIEYVGKVAQDPPMLKLRRMTPFDYAYGALAMMRKDGGVCGTHTSTSLLAGSALGLPMINCASPGHSFPATLGWKDGVYSAPSARVGVKWYFGADKPEGISNDANKLTSLAAAMSWGLQDFLDSQLGWTLCLQLPDDLRAQHGYTLMKSALLQNPYNVSLARALLQTAGTTEELISLWEDFQGAVLSAKEKTGCIQDGRIVGEVWDTIGKKLEAQPIPEDPALRDRVYATLCQKGCSPKLRAQYEAEIKGVDAVLMAATSDLTTHLDSFFRSDAGCKTMAARVQAAVDMVEDANRRHSWLNAQTTLLADRRLCLTKLGKRYKVVQDQAATLVAKLSQAPVDDTLAMKALLDQTTTGLDKHINNPRRTPTCKDMAARLRTIVAAAEEREIDLTAWAATWFKLMAGKEAYARHAWCQKDAASVVLDELVAKYPPDTQGAGNLADMEKRRRDLERELSDLNKNTAGGDNQDRINAINQELDELAAGIAAGDAATQH